MTPQEAAAPENHSKKHDWLCKASARDIQEHIRYCRVDGPHIGDFHVAKTALDIRLSEDAERTAQKLLTGTDCLVTETKTLVKLTHGLYFLTIVLICFGAFDVIKFFLGLLTPLEL